MQVNTSADRFDLSVSDRFLTLLTMSEAYHALGYSVLPLLGDIDPDRPKVPAVPWSRFQQAHASLAEHNQWFTESQFAGIGIVTGNISKLVVLDFDSEDIFKDFRAQHSDLIETHTVRSAGRQLPHLYFHLPSHLHIESMKGQGIDVLSNGRYVVAPPTTINGHTYKITRGGMPRTLTESDIRRIQKFLATQRPSSIPIKPAQETTIKKQTTPKQKPTPADLEALYRYNVGNTGRNEALFRTSLYARDTGWTQNLTQNLLVTVHRQQKAPQPHIRESQAKREREAIRTIGSAFSRPARQIQITGQTNYQQGYLSNSVREALMQRGMTNVVRTIEGLRGAGICQGQVFVVSQAIRLLQGRIGRDSILKALRAGEGSKKFFTPPVSPPETANAVATEKSQTVSKECSFEGGKNQQKVKTGRPKHLYRMPTNEELCTLLGVKLTHSDVLEPDDLTTARKTRMALHREMIKRRPGYYARSWMARRLGVNKRTIAAYNRLIPIHSKTMYIETKVNWHNLERLLPCDEPIQGAILVTQIEKRYPALRSIASRLLAKGESLILKQQTTNFYWVGDHEPIIPEPTHVIEEKPQRENLKAILSEQMRLETRPERFWPSIQPISNPVSKQDRVALKPSGNVQKPLTSASQEALAQHIYTTINGLNEKGGKTISQANARRIVLMQPENRIKAALHLIQQRKTIVNPAGFLMTVLGSNHTGRS